MTNPEPLKLRDIVEGTFLEALPSFTHTREQIAEVLMRRLHAAHGGIELDDGTVFVRRGPLPTFKQSDLEQRVRAHSRSRRS